MRRQHQHPFKNRANERRGLGEAILTVGALAISVGVVFLLATAITGSPAAGALAALMTVWIEPRLYNYPKLSDCG